MSLQWIWDLWYNTLQILGLHKKHGKLLFLGLDNAGKTTLLGLLKTGKVVQYEPSMRHTSQELVLGGITFTAFDVGGHIQARRIWKQFFPAVDGIVFIFDCADRERFQEANRELQGLLSSEEIGQCPMLILGNKIDKFDAAGEDEIRYLFGLNGLTTGKENIPREKLSTRPLELFMCSVKRNEGFGKAFRWLSQYLK